MNLEVSTLPESLLLIISLYFLNLILWNCLKMTASVNSPTETFLMNYHLLILCTAQLASPKSHHYSGDARR